MIFQKSPTSTEERVITSTAMTNCGTVPLVSLSGPEADGDERTRFPSVEEYFSFLISMAGMKARNPGAFHHIILPEGTQELAAGRIPPVAIKIDNLQQSMNVSNLSSDNHSNITASDHQNGKDGPGWNRRP